MGLRNFVTRAILLHMLKNQSASGYRPFMKSIGTVFMIVAASLSLTGCITYLTQINVRGDGSGTMVQTITMNPEQIKESMEGVAKQMGATEAESKEDPKNKPSKLSGKGPFKESDLKDKVADLGDGVTFVSAEEIDTKTAAGVRVTYAFKDINKLAVNPKPAAAMGTTGAGASSEDALKFKFTRRPNGNAVLTVVMPPPKQDTAKEQAAPPQPDAAKEQPATPPAESPGDPAQNMSMMIMQMFKGLHMGMAINVEGKVVKTNSPYVEGSKITLMDIDFDPLLSDAKGLKALEKMGPNMGDDRKAMEALKGIKGLKITTEPEISIEFAPDKKP